MNNEPKEVENFKNFINTVNIIFKIYDLIKDIYSCGYINKIEIEIQIKSHQVNYKGNILEETLYPEKVLEKLEEE